MALVHIRLNLGPLDNNTYLLICDASHEAAVVDAGFEPEAVLDALSRRRVHLRHLLNTHAHYDHACGMRTVQEAAGGEYWLHPGDRPLLARLSDQGAAFGFPPARPPERVNDLAYGEPIVLGAETIEVLHTPGHSPGSVSFRWGNHVWDGDVLFAGSVGRTDLPGGSWEDLERSIRGRLFPLGDGVEVHPGHGPATTIGRERRDNPFVGRAAGGIR